ncbi:MAG: hypothetical protein IJV22_09465 [Bacteroidales bacterium]|nr:hypothetical protein [Bacteroidales bacterium]
MKRLGLILLLVLACTPGLMRAQFSQDRPKAEYMFKADLGYMVFNSNVGEDKTSEFTIPDQRHIPMVSVMNGVCLNQDFFVGVGLGYGYAVPSHAMKENLSNGWHTLAAFVDADYRPLDRAWSPMAYAKLGATFMPEVENVRNATLSALGEIGLGLNWYYDYRYVNMERNYRSLYFEVGFAYTQMASFFTARLGVRF